MAYRQQNEEKIAFPINGAEKKYIYIPKLNLDVDHTLFTEINSKLIIYLNVK